MPYALGVDLGTCYTAAAVDRGGAIEPVPLGDHSDEMPSVLFLREDGAFLAGEAAVRRGNEDPQRMAREFKRRIGDATPVFLGPTPMAPEALAARLVRTAVAAVADRQGGEPDLLCVTIPANWGKYRRELMEQALRSIYHDQVRLTTEPAAAATYFASTGRLSEGDTVAIYDLGGGTFDAVVLQKTAAGFETLGNPVGIEHLGGVDFDDAVFHHVTASIRDVLTRLDDDDPEVQASLLALRRECTAAKEVLSADTSVRIPVLLPDERRIVRLNRDEFEQMIRQAVTDSVECLERAISSTGLSPTQIGYVVLVGGSSRIPLVSQLLTQRLERPVLLSPRPKQCVALGAAMQAGQGIAPVSSTNRAGQEPRIGRKRDPETTAALPPGPSQVGTTAGDDLPAVADARSPTRHRESFRGRRAAFILLPAALVLVAGTVIGLRAFGGKNAASTVRTSTTPSAPASVTSSSGSPTSVPGEPFALTAFPVRVEGGPSDQLYAHSRQISSHTTVLVRCALYGGALGGGGDRLWYWTDRGWINDHFVKTGTEVPRANSCSGTIATPSPTAHRPSRAHGPFAVLGDAGTVSVRAQPRLTAASVRAMAATSLVTINCHLSRRFVSAPQGGSSSSDWDRLDSGGWIPDAYLLTGNADGSPAPSCSSVTEPTLSPTPTFPGAPGGPSGSASTSASTSPTSLFPPSSLSPLPLSPSSSATPSP